METSLPADFQAPVDEFDRSITEVENLFKNLERVPLNDLQSQLSPLDKAKLDLVGAYAVGSLFYVYLKLNGEETDGHGIQTEINSVKTYMSRIKELEDKANAPRLDKGAAKRFVRNALWDAAHKKDSGTKRKSLGDESEDAETSTTKSVKKSH